MFRAKLILTVSLLVFGAGLTAQAGDPPNLALNGTATQSSEGWDGHAIYAIDGVITTRTHTGADDPNRWWELELDQVYTLKTIVVYNRYDCCGERLNDAVLTVLDANRVEVFVSDPITGAVTADMHSFDNGGAGFVDAKYIRVDGGTDFLSIAELQAFPFWPYAYDPDPADGAVDVDTRVLSWTPADNAVAHNVYLGTDPNALELIAEGATDMAEIGLEDGTTYYWRVDAIDAEGVVSESDLWTFTTLPLEAHFPSPSDGQGNVLDGTQLSWTAGKDVLLHNVYFGTDPNALAETPFYNETTFDPGPLEAGMTYYWRVDEFTGATTNEGPLWSFTTVPVLDEIADPNLRLYYDFESGAYTTVLDQSGYGNHAVFMRNPEWATGIAGGCLETESSEGDYVQTVAPLGITTDTVTVTGWVKHDTAPAAWSGILTTRGSGNLGLQHNGAELRYMWGADQYWWFSSGLNIPNGEWYFAALAVAPDQATLYLDGIGATATNVAEHLPVTFDSEIRVARDHQDSRIMSCLIDEVRLYDKTLTDEEILAVMALDPNQAQAPLPGNRTTVAPEDAMTLSWLPGEGATMHFVYLSTDRELVAASDPNVMLGLSAQPTMELTETPVRAVTYYWKVDEMGADGGTTEGRIWSFTTTDENTDMWAEAVAVDEPNFVATHVEPDSVHDIGELGGEITYELVVRANPDETAVSMALIGRFGDFAGNRAALKFEQWNNTGNYGATIFGVMDYDFGVANAVGEYVHLTFVSSEAAGTTSLYVNGVLQGTVDTAISLSGLVGIGSAIRNPEGENSIDVFDGEIYGVAIYAGALSEEQMRTHVNAYFLRTFSEDFESYEPGSQIHGQGGWKGWFNDAGAGALVSDANDPVGVGAVEILGSSDLVHEFDIDGGTVTLTAMQYIPSGTTGTTYFILLNTYNDDNIDMEWSVQTTFDLATGAITTYSGATGAATIVYDEWVELKCVIDLDNNTVVEYYDGIEIDNRAWSGTGRTTLQAIDLYGANASSVYYDDINIR